MSLGLAPRAYWSPSKNNVRRLSGEQALSKLILAGPVLLHLQGDIQR